MIPRAVELDCIRVRWLGEGVVAIEFVPLPGENRDQLLASAHLTLRNSRDQLAKGAVTLWPGDTSEVRLSGWQLFAITFSWWRRRRKRKASLVRAPA